MTVWWMAIQSTPHSSQGLIIMLNPTTAAPPVTVHEHFILLSFGSTYRQLASLENLSCRKIDINYCTVGTRIKTATNYQPHTAEGASLSASCGV